MGVARFVKNVSEKFHGVALVYEVDPPVYYEKEDTERGYLMPAESSFVVVSAAVVPSFSGSPNPETYIFASDSEGKILSCGELPGSFKGALDHKLALEKAGYEEVRD